MNEPVQTLGPIRLAPGVRRVHVCAYLFAAFVSIGLFTYLATLTPYILAVHLRIPPGAQGVVTGTLQVWQEIVMLGLLGFWGAMSDRLGRRPVYVAGFLVLALAYGLYPTAGSLTELTAYRLVFGVALAALTAMLAAVVADYADEDSRGKLTGFSYLLNGIGAVLSFVLLSRLPGVFAAEGADPVQAGRYTYWTVAGIALLAAGVMLALKPGRPVQVRDRTSVGLLLRDGVLAARNPRISLAYLGAFAARADMAAISLFLTLWIVQAATSSGASPGRSGSAGRVRGGHGPRGVHAVFTGHRHRGRPGQSPHAVLLRVPAGCPRLRLGGVAGRHPGADGHPGAAVPRHWPVLYGTQLIGPAGAGVPGGHPRGRLRRAELLRRRWHSRPLGGGRLALRHHRAPGANPDDRPGQWPGLRLCLRASRAGIAGSGPLPDRQ